MFDNVITLNIADVIINVAAGAILGRVNLRYAVCSASILILVGGILISCARPTTGMMPFFLILTRGGAGGLLAICYVATASMFPTLFSASAFGICNIAARSFTIFAPQIAEMAAPKPMLFLCLVSGFAAVFAHFLYDEVTMIEES